MLALAADGVRPVCVVAGVTAQDADHVRARHTIDAATIRAQFEALRDAKSARSTWARSSRRMRCARLRRRSRRAERPRRGRSGARGQRRRRARGRRRRAPRCATRSFARATLITPNLGEASAFLGRDVVRHRRDARGGARAARVRRARGARQRRSPHRRRDRRPRRRGRHARVLVAARRRHAARHGRSSRGHDRRGARARRPRSMRRSNAHGAACATRLRTACTLPARASRRSLKASRRASARAGACLRSARVCPVSRRTRYASPSSAHRSVRRPVRSVRPRG